MDQPHQLLDLFRLWREFSEAEGVAIRVGDWARVESCQNAKLKLQEQMTEASAELKPVVFVEDVQLRRSVEELIALERENDRALAEQRAALETRGAELAQTTRNVRLLQQSYRSPRAAAWHSYS